MTVYDYWNKGGEWYDSEKINTDEKATYINGINSFSHPYAILFDELGLEVIHSETITYASRNILNTGWFLKKPKACSSSPTLNKCSMFSILILPAKLPQDLH